MSARNHGQAVEIDQPWTTPCITAKADTSASHLCSESSPVPSIYSVHLVNVGVSAGRIDDGRHDHPHPHGPLPRDQDPPRPGARKPRVAAPTGRPPTHRAMPRAGTRTTASQGSIRARGTSSSATPRAATRSSIAIGTGPTRPCSSQTAAAPRIRSASGGRCEDGRAVLEPPAPPPLSPGARYAARFTNAPISGRRLSTCSGRWPPRFTTRRCTPSSP